MSALSARSVATRRPRFRRHRFGKPAFVLQDRDREILRLVAESRLVTSQEIQALITGSDQSILRRLNLLFHHGYLDRPQTQKQRGNAKFVYTLGRAGALEIGWTARQTDTRDWAERNRDLQLRYIEHGLMISRLHAALMLATRVEGRVMVERWAQGKSLRDEVVIPHSDWKERIPVCPDAYFALRLLDQQEGFNRIHVFVEADRSTMTIPRFAVKMRGYWHYWRSGRQEKRFGFRNFLVLTVTISMERATNLAKATHVIDAPRHRGLRMFLFGCESAYSVADPSPVLGAIWQSPADKNIHRLTE
jgi:hypothetical protein